MSNFLRKRRSTANGTEFVPTKKQRLIDTTKVLLDIAKESADVFPPLKSCLGGIGALIKHYEETKDVQEKIRDLIPWLNKLKDTAATTKGIDTNPEETERRERLKRSLESIEKRSQALLRKGKKARILDKSQDSRTVLVLVEELRQGILIYQLTQQRAIENQVTQLATSFNAFLKFREESPDAKGKIKSTLTRLDKLKVEVSPGADEEEHKRGKVLFEVLEVIKDNLQQISERSSAVGCQGNDIDTRAVCKLADDVRDAVSEYQLFQQTALYEQNCRLINTVESQVLDGCRRARGAGYQHGDRRGCLNGTRGTVLDEIERWTEDPEQSPIFWLHGLAGTGKTTIAQTVAERLFADGRLGASFFCSRGSDDRSNLHLIFPTLAFQLAQRYPKFRSSLVPLLCSDPDIVYQPIDKQMKKLLVKPLQLAGISTVIMIDALDECKDKNPESTILPVLGRSILDIPQVKIFITSRPESHIVAGFRENPLQNLTNVFILHEVHPYSINNDIRCFLQHELSKLAQRHGGTEDWPTDSHLNWLCQRAAGFFVYAVATVNFLDHHFEDPWDRLNMIMASPESTAHEGETKLEVYKSLDSLYMSILHMTFLENTAKDDDTVRSVLSAVVLTSDPLSPSAIATLIGSNCNKVQRILKLIQSLLILSPDPDHPVHPFHKSFSDFLTNPTRCTSRRFFISPNYNAKLLIHCLNLIGNPMKNPGCSLSDLPEEVDVCDALQYACTSWHKHLIVMESPTLGALSALLTLLEVNFFCWFRTMDIIEEAYGGIGVLDDAHWWFCTAQVNLPETVVCHHDQVDTTYLVGQLEAAFDKLIQLA